MEKETDKRLHSRVKLIKWPAKIVIKDESIDGTTRNISVNGAFIYYFQPHGNDLPLQLNKAVDVIIEAPDRPPLFMLAEVVWSDILSSDEKNTLLGVGLHFTEISYEDRQFLHSVITKYHKPSPDVS